MKKNKDQKCAKCKKIIDPKNAVQIGFSDPIYFFKEDLIPKIIKYQCCNYYCISMFVPKKLQLELYESYLLKRKLDKIEEEYKK